MKIHFDSEVFEKKIFPSNSSAKSEIREAIRILNDSYIPYDFAYRNSLKGFAYNIETIHGKINKYNDWAEAVKSKIEKAEEDYLYEISKNDIQEVKKRENLVAK